MLTFSVIECFARCRTKINHITQRSCQIDFFRKFKNIVGFFSIETNNIDTLTVLWDIPIVFPIENLPLDEVVVLSQSFTNDLKSIPMVMTNHVLYIFDENSTRFSSLNHPKQFEEKITTIIIKTLAVTRNTKSLTREASHNHIHTFSRNVFRLNRMNIPTIQMRVRIIQTISLTRILIKFIGIHHSELVGLFKSQLNSPNT